MDTIGWYVLRRTFQRFVLLLAIFLGALVGGQFGLLIGRGVPPEACLPAVTAMLLFALPLALPLALSSAILVILGGMNRDGEFRALAACGISHMVVVRRLAPLVIAGVVASALFSHLVLPRAVAGIRANKGRFAQALIAQRVAANEPLLQLADMSVWAGGAEGGELRDVFISQRQAGQLTGFFAPMADWRLYDDHPGLIGALGQPATGNLGATAAMPGAGKRFKKGLVIQLHDVQALRRSAQDKSEESGEIPGYSLLIPDTATTGQEEPDALPTSAVIALLQTDDPAKDWPQYNNARLTLQLRLFLPIAVAVYALFAAGLALVFAAVDTLIGVAVIVVVVAAATYPTIGYVKTQVETPHMLHPAFLLWPPLIVLVAVGCWMLWRPDQVGELIRLPFAAIARRWGRH